MTLEEYCSQKDPQRMPNVQLQWNEVVTGSTITRITGPSYTLVYIIDDCAKICWGAEYLLKGSTGRLWTTDSDGNPKELSCFRLTIPDYQVRRKKIKD